MPDKKLTDAEIVKALECCISGEPCYKTKCPFKIKKICGDDIKALEKSALDLINRLQAKNSNLTSDLTSLQNDLTSAKAEIERLKPFEDKIAEFKSHIRVEDMLVFASSLEEWLEFCDNLKAEAYKECLEKIEQRDVSESDFYVVVKKTEFNNLLKELVGEIDG